MTTKSTSDVYTVSEFCQRHRIARGTLYNLWKRGDGPAFIKAGASVRITMQAVEDWRRRMEDKSYTKQAA